MADSEVLVDRISLLPTDVLGCILSQLTLKEAIATSILSRCWRYLWTLTPKLDLDRKVMKRSKLEEERCDHARWVEEERCAHARWYLNFFLSPDQVERLIDQEGRCDYVKWVDSVVSLHQSSRLSSNLEEFRVASDLNNDHRGHINKWLSYALSRGVQRLELNFNSIPIYVQCYTFPSKTWNFPDNFKLLRSLFMCLVNVTGEALEFFLANCPHLERLSVIESQVLSSLEIIRPFSSFNYLEISCCDELKSVVVRDSSLVTINYNGNQIKFQLVNVPLLTQLWIRGSLTKRLDDVAKMFSSVLPQLEIFKIFFTYRALYQEGTRRFASAVEMSNLKQLVVSLWTDYNQSDTLLPIIYLINASPRLQRFVLEAPRGDNECPTDGIIHAKGVSKMMPRAYSHHLKEIEFVGYHGEFNLFELMKHFVEKDFALENIIVDPRCYTYRAYRPWVRIPRGKMEEEIAARASTKEQLKRFVPSRINVKIL